VSAPDLSYREQRDKLADRIRAHKVFANFDVADWIDEFLGRRPRRHVLDLGCGDGNHFPLYLKHVGEQGTVTGLDREPQLLERARRAHEGAANLTLVAGSMDEPLPFPEGRFDLAFSNFAIYNARAPLFTLRELFRVLEPGGELVLIGPTRANAFELYEYNQRLTGTPIDEVTLVRTDRLRAEILPLAREVFGQVQEHVLSSRLTFPTREEFLRYFTATMLYEQVAEKMGKSEEEMLAACGRESDLVVSKEMLALVATRA
jgi:ubiquinone/menaquinone biosynthesis C-methylase UbiE